MTYITLVCTNGLSTSMLVQRMQKVAKEKNLEVDIVAISESAFRNENRPTQILLLGPQISYMLPTLKSYAEPKGIKVALIDMMDYGMMDGAAVLNKALAML